MTDLRKKASPAVVLIILFFFAHIAIFSEKVNMCISVKERLLLALLVIIFLLPIHEFIHYILMKFFGLKNIKIEIARDPLLFPIKLDLCYGLWPWQHKQTPECRLLRNRNQT